MVRDKVDPPAEIARAIAHLAKGDRKMAAHIKRNDVCDIRPRMGGRSHFEQLARMVTYQQLAGRAAATIWGRTRALVKGRFTASSVLALTPEEMRSAGLSNNKMLSIRDLAAHVQDGRVPFARFPGQPDEVIIEALTRVRGIGRWTAEMFLMTQMFRLDVWPSGDLGVRNGYRILYELPELPSVRELEVAGDRFAPFRSIAAWYCWRAADTVIPVKV